MKLSKQCQKVDFGLGTVMFPLEMMAKTLSKASHRVPEQMKRKTFYIVENSLRSDLDTDKGSADNTGLGCAGSDFGRLGQSVLVLCAAEFLFMKTFIGWDFITAVSFCSLTFFVLFSLVADFVVDLVKLWNNTCDQSNFSLFDVSCSP